MIELNDYYTIDIHIGYTKKGKIGIYSSVCLFDTTPCWPGKESTVTFNFTGKEEYLDFVKQWKEAYASISSDIKKSKEAHDCYTVAMLRRKANTLLWIRFMGKKEASRQTKINTDLLKKA